MFLASVLLFRSFIYDSDGSLRALAGIDLSMVALVIVVCVLRTLGVGISFCTLGDGVGLITVDVGVLIITLGVGVMIVAAEGLDVGSKVTFLVVSSLVFVIGMLFNRSSSFFSASYSTAPCVFLHSFSACVRSFKHLTIVSSGVMVGMVMCLCLK